MATIIRSINGERATTRPVKVTLPVEIIDYIKNAYPHMSESAAIRACLMDEFAAYVSSVKVEGV